MKGNLLHNDKAYLFHLEKPNFYLTLVDLNLTKWLKWDKESQFTSLAMKYADLQKCNRLC